MGANHYANITISLENTAFACANYFAVSAFRSISGREPLHKHHADPAKIGISCARTTFVSKGVRSCCVGRLSGRQREESGP